MGLQLQGPFTEHWDGTKASPAIRKQLAASVSSQ